MKLANLAEGVLVADQILVDDVTALAAQGVKTITCHRPDGEGADQPNFEEISKAAKKLKIQGAYRYPEIEHYRPHCVGKKHPKPA